MSQAITNKMERGMSTAKRGTAPTKQKEHKRGDVTVRKRKGREFIQYWQAPDRYIEVGPFDEDEKSRRSTR